MDILKKHRRAAAIVAALLLVTWIPACSAQSSAAPRTKLSAAGAAALESGGFDSPESAAKAYLESLRNQDLAGMVSCFAVESYVDLYDFSASLERAQVYTFIQREIPIPVVDDFSRNINIEERKSKIVNSILRQYMAISKADVEYYSSLVPVKEREEQEELIAQLSEYLKTVDFGSIKLLGYIPPETFSDIYASEVNQKNLSEMAKICGADRIESCVAVAEIGGNPFLFCFDVMEYNGKWFIKELGGNIAVMIGISYYMIGTMPLDEEDELILEDVLVPAK